MSPADKIKQIQAILGVTADGLFGPKSKLALEDLIVSVVSHGTQEPVPEGDRVDERSEKAIATLHRRVQPLARELVKEAGAAGIVIKITSGTRTYAEQDALYAKGGVTRAKGGWSNHNFGLAFDFTLFKGNQPVWESPDYEDVGEIGKDLGLTWGGDWTSFRDEPHFELRPEWADGMSESRMLAELRRRHDNAIDYFA